MSGCVYLVGTPIGNLSDITYRAIETLNKVDFIAVEDTRVTIKLLNHYKIKKPMISCHGHNELKVSHNIIERLKAGEKCALVSDAGLPCISDPGSILVKSCLENDIEVKIIPGPNAALAALCISGMDTSKFCFEGFLSTNKNSRFSTLDKVKYYSNTLVFYEAPHKLLTTLKDMLFVLGDRKVAIVKELTKIHEKIYKLSLSEAVMFYSENIPKGEYVIIVEGKKVDDNINEYTFDQAFKLVSELIESGQKLSLAVKEVSFITGHNKRDLYKAYISINEL